MRRRGRQATAVLLLLIAALSVGCQGPTRICRQSAGRYEHPCGGATRTFHYLLYRPPGHGQPRPGGAKWPLLVYLPGALTYGTDVREIPDGDPPAQIERGRDLPMVVISVMTPGFGELWDPDVVAGVIDHAIARYDVDPRRVYLTGVCVGGTGVWDTIKAHPERVAAAVPLCAWGSVRGIERAVEVPVWAFHGRFDFVAPAFRHKRLVDAHRRAGGSACWTALPRMHWIWASVYGRDEVYAWMLAQRKGDRLLNASRSPARATSRTSGRGYAIGSAEVGSRGTGSSAGRAARTAR